MASTDPTHEVFTTEYFGPILGVLVYDDADWSPMLAQADVAQDAPTGSVFATDRGAIAEADRAAPLGRQLLRQRQADRGSGRAAPFGGPGVSGTDKAG